MKMTNPTRTGWGILADFFLHDSGGIGVVAEQFAKSCETVAVFGAPPLLLANIYGHFAGRSTLVGTCGIYVCCSV